MGCWKEGREIWTLYTEQRVIDAQPAGLSLFLLPFKTQRE